MAEGYTVAQLLTKVLLNMGLTADAGATDLRVYQALTAAGRAAATWQGSPWWWCRGRGSFVPVSLTGLTAVRTSNVVTFTATAAHTLIAGQHVRVTGVTDSTMDGTFPVASSTTPAFTYASTGDDSSSSGGSVYSDEYVLRTVNSASMADLKYVTGVYMDDDWRLTSLSWDQYRNGAAMSLKENENQPTGYTISENINGPVMHLTPTPNTTDRIYVDYIKFHKAIALGGDTNLIVPLDYQEGIYVAGATWLMRSDLGPASSLLQCPDFVEAMNRMQQSAPSRGDNDPDDMYLEPGSGSGRFPQDKKVISYPDGEYIILNDGSI